MSSGGEQTRDIKNHLLFEIATEVAHRGESIATAVVASGPSSHANFNVIQSVVSTLLSSPKLL